MTSLLAFIDFDRTLNDADSVMSELLDGLLGLSGQEAIDAFTQTHELVHTRFPERHDDARFALGLLLERHRRPGDHATLEEVQERYREAWNTSWRAPRLFPDALPFLRGLKSQGFRLFLATGDHAPQKAEHLRRLAGEALLDGAFDPVTLGRDKGSVEYVERALAQAGASSEDPWFVGDSLRNDIEPARRLGLRALWVNRRGLRLQAQDPTPTETVHDLYAALAIMTGVRVEAK